MENATTITTMISTLGFPIAMCIFFAWYVIQRDEKEKEQSDKHKEEIDNLSSIIQNNTLTMQKLVDKLDSIIGLKKEE